MHAADEGAVVRRYLSTDDITEVVGAGPSRWIIDFGTMPLEEARKYPEAMKIVRAKVRPERNGKGRHFERLWWQFAWPRPNMREAIVGLDRFLVSTLTGKRLLVSWADQEWCPSNSVGVFAFDDDYAMGIMASNTFDAWAWEESSTFETRLRLTPSTAFETFPWPSPTAAARAAVAQAARNLIENRAQTARSHGLGLTELYNLVDDGAFTELVARHRALDEAVVAAYGWPKGVVEDRIDRLARLAELNQQITQGDVAYAPFA